MKLYRAVVALVLIVACADAAPPMRPGNLTVDVKVEQSQRTVTHLRSAAGDYAKTDRNRRTLRVTLRRVGDCVPDVNVYAFFIARDTSGRTSGFYGASVQQARANPGAGTTVELESDDIFATRDRLFDFQVVTGDYPHGWVVLVYQAGTKLHEVGSTPEMIKWLWKNLPKQEASKLK